MRARKALDAGMAAVGLAVLLTALRPGITARQLTGKGGSVDDDIGGVVTGETWPEAGVWVIEETKDLPTGDRKIVVTDDRALYLVPDLPKASYNIWVRGYGLVDSPRVQ